MPYTRARAGGSRLCGGCSGGPTTAERGITTSFITPVPTDRRMHQLAKDAPHAADARVEWHDVRRVEAEEGVQRARVRGDS